MWYVYDRIRCSACQPLQSKQSETKCIAFISILYTRPTGEESGSDIVQVFSSMKCEKRELRIYTVNMAINVNEKLRM